MGKDYLNKKEIFIYNCEFFSIVQNLKSPAVDETVIFDCFYC